MLDKVWDAIDSINEWAEEESTAGTTIIRDESEIDIEVDNFVCAVRCADNLSKSLMTVLVLTEDNLVEYNTYSAGTQKTFYELDAITEVTRDAVNITRKTLEIELRGDTTESWPLKNDVIDEFMHELTAELGWVSKD